jgi:hypothetical protein
LLSKVEEMQSAREADRAKVEALRSEREAERSKIEMLKRELAQLRAGQQSRDK